jgi:hypothetical protein
MRSVFIRRADAMSRRRNASPLRVRAFSKPARINAWLHLGFAGSCGSTGKRNEGARYSTFVRVRFELYKEVP